MIPASGCEHHQHRSRSWVPFARSRIDLRHAMAPRAQAEASDAPNGAGASSTGGRAAVGTAGARSERHEWAYATGRSEK